MWMIRKTLQSLSSILFPPLCYICKKRDALLCRSCISSLARSIDTESLYIYSSFSYRDPHIKKILHAIKYFHKKDLLNPLALVLAEDMKKQGYSGLLIPVPMSPVRKYIRGYNQAEELTKILSRITGLPYATGILKRSLITKRQVTMSTKKERLQNPKRTFHLTSKKDILKNKNIILVDDITTTGATLSEARSMLLGAGAKNVQAVTLAH